MWGLGYVELPGEPTGGEKRGLGCPFPPLRCWAVFLSCLFVQIPEKQKHHHCSKHEVGVTGGEREKKK